MAPLEGALLKPEGIESPNLLEALQLVAVNDRNERYTYQIFFKKGENKKVELGEEFNLEGESINFLEPIIQIWSKSGK